MFDTEYIIAHQLQIPAQMPSNIDPVPLGAIHNVPYQICAIFQ